MPRWTPEARLKQAASIRGWLPWTLSTGPQTAAGKARSSRNAWKGGFRARLGNWREVLRQIALGTERVWRNRRVISLFRRKPRVEQMAGGVPAAALSSFGPCLDAADDGDEVDRMSSADLMEAYHRLLAGGLGDRTCDPLPVTGVWAA